MECKEVSRLFRASKFEDPNYFIDSGFTPLINHKAREWLPKEGILVSPHCDYLLDLKNGKSVIAYLTYSEIDLKQLRSIKDGRIDDSD